MLGERGGVLAGSSWLGAVGGTSAEAAHQVFDQRASAKFDFFENFEFLLLFRLFFNYFGFFYFFRFLRIFSFF